MTATIAASPWRRLYEIEGVPIHLPQAQVRGAIPPELRGTHYRVGPLSGRAYGRPLPLAGADADGYVCAYTFTDKGVEVRGDIVRTLENERERAAGKSLYSTFSTVPNNPLPLRMARGILGVTALVPFIGTSHRMLVKDPPNHVPCVLGERLVLIGGAGRPYALRLADLSVLGPETFGTALPQRQVLLVGESHLDPTSGERCFLEICTYPPGIRLWSVGSDGRGRGSRRIALPKLYLPHDFGLTRSKIVVPVGPIHTTIPKVLLAFLGIGTMNAAFTWHANAALLYYVIDRKTHIVRTHYSPASFPAHIANAFDSDGDVVLDMNLHNDDAALRGFTASVNHDAGHPDFVNRLYRIRLTSDGTVENDELVPFDCEVPYSNEAYDGRRSRYVYASVTARGIAGSERIVKVDAETHQYRFFSYGADCVASQPVFVPRPNATAEDDGWVLCQVYDGIANRTFVSIVDGDLGTERARVLLPYPLPYLLHGKFVSAESASNAKRPAHSFDRSSQVAAIGNCPPSSWKFRRARK